MTVRALDLHRSSPAMGHLHHAAAAHPADLDRLALLDDHRHRARSTRELQHPRSRFGVLLNVELNEVDAAPLEILACRGAVLAARGRVQLDRPAHPPIPPSRPRAVSHTVRLDCPYSLV